MKPDGICRYTQGSGYLGGGMRGANQRDDAGFMRRELKQVDRHILIDGKDIVLFSGVRIRMTVRISHRPLNLVA